MRRSLAVALVVLFVPIPGAQADSHTPTEYDRYDETFTGEAEATIVYTKWIPKGDGPFPAVMTTHGWPGRHDEGTPWRWAEFFAERGYIVYAVTQRGFGDSGGNTTLAGPNEISDMSTLIGKIANEPKIQLDGPGDPRIGFIGRSYAGGIAMLTAKNDDRVDAIIPITTWSSLTTSLHPNDVLKLGWVQLLFVAGTLETNELDSGGGVDPDNPPAADPDQFTPSVELNQWYATIMALNDVDANIEQELGSIRAATAGKLDVPTLLIQGFPDTLFPVSEAERTANILKGKTDDYRVIYYPGGHGYYMAWDDPRQTYIDEQVEEWFNIHLKDEDATLPPYPLTRYRYLQDDYVGEVGTKPAGTDIVTYNLHQEGGGGLNEDAPDQAYGWDLVAEPAPASCTEVPNFASTGEPACGYETDETFQYWYTEPFETDMEVTGRPQLTLQTTTTQVVDTTLFAKLLIVDPDGTKTTFNGQVTPLGDQFLLGGQTAVTFNMEYITGTVPAGSSLGVQVSTSDFSFGASRESGVVTINSSTVAPSQLRVPFVPVDAHGDREAPDVEGFMRFSANGIPKAHEYLDDNKTFYVVVNETRSLHLFVDDDLAVRNITVMLDGQEIEAATRQVSLGITNAIYSIEYLEPADHILTVKVNDFLGRETVRTYDVSAVYSLELAYGCVDESGQECAYYGRDGNQKSPGVFVLAPILAALALLRRRS